MALTRHRTAANRVLDVVVGIAGEFLVVVGLEIEVVSIRVVGGEKDDGVRMACV